MFDIAEVINDTDSRNPHYRLRFSKGSERPAESPSNGWDAHRRDAVLQAELDVAIGVCFPNPG